MKILKLSLSVILCLSALFGDYIVFKSSYSVSPVFRAISDSAVHGLIGFISALTFFTHDINISSYACISCVAICTILSSLIDIDHAIVARSIYLKDILNQKHPSRGILHCTTLWIVISSTLLSYSYVYKKLIIYLSTFMIILAFTTHHIRDANRRGLWLYPLGHTCPIQKHMYVTIIGIIPHISAVVYKYFEANLLRYRVVEYGSKIVV